MSEPTNVPIQPVANPIICPPYDEPRDHWVYDKMGVATRAGKRREAGYFYKTERTGSAQQALPGMAQEERDDLPLVNVLRDDVRRWREADYRGASNVTKELLRWWANPARGRRLFFCQREAVETIIYLAELRIPGRTSKVRFTPKLSDEALGQLLRGEKPRGLNLTSETFWPTLMDRPFDPNLRPLTRLGCKMATGSGKTVVMSLLIAWAFCNRGVNPRSTEYPNAVLVCCPNLTVKERLQVLRPDNPDNYFTAFDLVPVNLRPYLHSGKVLVENWHRFAPESEHKEGDKSYQVVNKGPETPETIARRVLGDLYDRLPILVLNDEGHHCWRPAGANDEADEPVTPSRGRKKKPVEDDSFVATEEEQAEARVWLEGLDRINNCLGPKQPGISFCVDLSATPFYLRGSGYPEGQPFPWLVSDFGLVDAIESGIVKIPRLPVSDDAKKKDEIGRPDPKYFRLWHHISAAMKPHEKHGSGKPKAEPCYREAEGALKVLAGQWKEKFGQFRSADANQVQIPPVLIVVCDNTDIADYFFRKISGESEADIVTPQDVEEVEAGEDEEPTPGKKEKAKKQVVYGKSEILDEFANAAARKVTIRIDTKLLAEAESADPTKNRKTAAEELRKVIATVGRPGEPGEHVRCVVSVSMLTEGWDANNVTHILGVRAFGSQLLCEQVIGRGLRRMNYEPDPATGLLQEEHVDVYGIPFSVIPFKGRAVNQSAPEDKPKHRVWAVPDRSDWEIKFPIVKGYVFEMTKGHVRCDVDAVEPITVDAKNEPTATFLRPTVGYHDSSMPAVAPFEFVEQTRDAYFANVHFQSIVFHIAQKIVDDLLTPTTTKTDRKSRVLRLQARHHLFPQVLRIVQQYISRRVNLNGKDARELGLEKYVTWIVERLESAIYPDEQQGEPPLLPILDPYRPVGRTGVVDFPTTRPVTVTEKSHLNLVVQHSDWEGASAKKLDKCGHVKCYARNDHLGLAIPYEYLESEHSYEPDFIVRLTNELNLLLEIKGFEVHNTERNNAKYAAARRWARAVNNLKEFGTWDFLVVRDVQLLAPEMASLAEKIA
ncbi:BPTD_3080 family restriction endonuclease [Limnoglobus roseus]|uniref:Restriction endonuclease n=1 Tax=Limnoglobus roseus TaxID=2598579 RepID=A0A5C1AFL8_9BACT|nr:DEAD/DEAH box helicase family protein [Limnoglobus roseus]QEL17385.1 restriction endonuclease [Limnoglobus roseus]